MYVSGIIYPLNNSLLFFIYITIL